MKWVITYKYDYLPIFTKWLQPNVDLFSRHLEVLNALTTPMSGSSSVTFSFAASWCCCKLRTADCSATTTNSWQCEIVQVFCISAFSSVEQHVWQQVYVRQIGGSRSTNAACSNSAWVIWDGKVEESPVTLCKQRWITTCQKIVIKYCIIVGNKYPAYHFMHVSCDKKPLDRMWPERGSILYYASAHILKEGWSYQCIRVSLSLSHPMIWWSIHKESPHARNAPVTLASKMPNPAP